MGLGVGVGVRQVGRANWAACVWYGKYVGVRVRVRVRVRV